MQLGLISRMPSPSENGETTERPLLPALGRNNGGGGAGGAGGAIIVANTSDITGNNKRLPADTVGLAPAPKRRAPRACTSCRSRKVRCDVSTNNSMPCTNCRLDSVECRLTTSSRGRPRLVQETEMQEAAASAAAQAPSPPQPQPQPQPQQQQQRARRMSAVATSPRPENNCHHNHNHRRHHVTIRRQSAAAADLYASAVSPSPTWPTLHTQGRGDDTNFFVSPRSLSVSDSGMSSTATSACSPASVVVAAPADDATHTQHTQLANCAGANAASSIPAYIPAHFKPLPAHLQPVDIEYLARKGALTLPEEEVQREIILKHIQYVHPFMPILNLPDFLTSLVRREPGSCSFLLFQAVMFTSANFIDMNYHRVDQKQPPGEAPDHAAIRKTFFSRARLLYDQDCEQDRLTLLQALLLMTVWYQRPGDEKEETWYWTGVMLSLAQTLGLHRNPEHLQDVPLEMRLLRKRIWWSCLVQDRLLALGLKRPSRIRRGDYDVPPLTFEDFNIETLSSELLRYLGPLPLSDDTPSKTSIVLSFIALSQLCVLIGDILATQYSSLLSSGSSGKPVQPISLDHLAVMVVPRSATGCVDELEQCDAALDAWAAALDSGARFRAGRHEKDSSHRVLWLHQAVLHMVYLTTVVMLHRPRVLQADSRGGGGGGSVSCREAGGDDDGDNCGDGDSPFTASIRRSKDKITRAAAGITEVIYDLYHDSQLRFVSPAAISALVSATLIHLFDVRSAGPDARYTSIGRFYQCWQALHYLRGLYASADQSIAFLEFYISKTQVNIPMLTLSPAAAGMSMSVSVSARGTAQPGIAGGAVGAANASGSASASSGSPSVATPHSHSHSTSTQHAMSVMTSLHSEVQPPPPQLQSSSTINRDRPRSISSGRLPSVSNLVTSSVASPGPRVPGISSMSLSVPMAPLIYSSGSVRDTRDDLASAPRSPPLHDPLLAAVAAVDAPMTSAMEPTIVVGPHMHSHHQPHHQHQHEHDEWSGMGAIDSMLQSFIDFNADSAFFATAASVEHDGMVSSPTVAHLRSV
ncbi:hypothetical protein Sste5346_005305 [Sporothrix stenoceras]|uniref:Zn(2)-C6 fungal-type domain-containing protein n=1 Tax=Sporothrix stenoceras TaxID=5173 RepID=A0ABR3Z5E9_9PEZI